MKKRAAIISGIVILVLGAFAFTQLMPAGPVAWARGGWGGGMGRGMGGGGCGMMNYGTPGGADYMPGSGNAPGRALTSRGAVSKDQAGVIAAGYIARINPEYRVGTITDKGPYYEVTISHNGSTVDRVAVDKASGLVRPLS